MQAKSSMHQLEVVSTTSKATKSRKEENQRERKTNIKTSARNDLKAQILPQTQAANNQAQARVHRAVLSHLNFSKEIVHTATAVNTGNMMQTLQTHPT